MEVLFGSDQDRQDRSGKSPSGGQLTSEVQEIKSERGSWTRSEEQEGIYRSKDVESRLEEIYGRS